MSSQSISTNNHSAETLQLAKAKKLAKLFYFFMAFDIVAALIGIAIVLFYHR
jgi:hypothetical protein